MRWKKLLSKLLVCCMLTSMLPVSAVNEVGGHLPDGTTAILEEIPDENKSNSEIEDGGSQLYALTEPQSGTCGDDEDSSNLTWTLTSDGTLTISGTGKMTEYPWKTDYASDIISVVIENGVTSICSNAFNNCSSLTSIEIPNSVTSIGLSAFRSSGLTSIVIPGSVTSIGQFALENCSKLKTTTIESGVEFIGWGAFKNCSSLTSIVLPESVISIDHEAFSGCSSLMDADIPSSVTHIGTSAFSGCRSLRNVEIPDGLTRIDQYAFSGCSSLTDISIPNSVTHIWTGAFSGCTGLTSVTIPNSVTRIDGQAFANCRNITRLTIPGSVTLSGQAFSGCSGLKSAGPIGSGYDFEFGWTEKIPANAFYGCSGLINVTIPESVTSLGDAPFGLCTALTTITVEGSNQNYCTIDGVLFNKEMTEIIRFPGGKQGDYTIPSGVTVIRIGAFGNCGELTSITIPNTVTRIGENAFKNCKKITNVVIPDSVTSVGNSAFSGCFGLQGVTIGKGVRHTGQNTFDGCKSLTSVSFPDNIEQIDQYAFRDCTSLRSVIIPDGVTGIGYMAFSGCSSLTDVTLPNTLPGFSGSSFSNCSNLGDVYYGGSEAEWGRMFNVNNSIPASATIHCYWGKYKITYNSNGGTGTMDAVAAKPETAFVLPTNSFVAPQDHRFKAWEINGIEFLPGDNYVPTEDTVIKAVWEVIPKYTIAYDPNGGSGTVSSTVIAEGEVYIVARRGNVIRVGYDFAGWNTKADGSGDCYIEGVSITVTGDITLYAQWSPADTDVAWVTVDGVYAVRNDTEFIVVLPDTTEQLPTSAESIQIGTSNDGAKITMPITSDFGEIWSFKIIAEDGVTETSYIIIVSIAKDPAEDNIAALEVLATVVKTHNWTVAQADANTEVTVKSWIESQLSSMHLNGADYSVELSSASPATEGKLSDLDGSDGSFSFKVTLSKGSGNTYAETTVTIANGIITATKYVPAMYTVTYDANGGSGTVPTRATVTEGERHTVADRGELTNGAYQFVGWNTKANATGIAYQPGAEMMLKGDVTLYAQWRLNTRTVSGTITGHKGVVYTSVSAELVSMDGITYTGTVGSGIPDGQKTQYPYSVHAPDGKYTLIVTAWTNQGAEVTRTHTVNLKNKDAQQHVNLPNGQAKAKSEVTVQPDAPQVLVDGLDAILDQTIEENTDIKAVEVKFVVEVVDETAPGVEEIKKQAGQAQLQFVELTISKEVTTKSDETSSEKLKELNGVVQLMVPFDSEGKKDIQVHRYHGNQVETLTTVPNEDGERIEVFDDHIVIYSKKFSVYAIGFAEKTSEDEEEQPEIPPVEPEQPSNPKPSVKPDYSDNSGSYGYQIVVSQRIEHGKITVSPKYAVPGEVVTISVKSDDGYQLSELTVTDSQGNSIQLTDAGNGTFTFVMPKGQITVQATFTHIETIVEPWSNGFTDVQVDAWYYDAVGFMVQNGWMSGYDDTNFGVNDSLSRAQLVQILYNMEGKPSVIHDASFKDVSSSAWFANAVTWASYQKLVSGYGNGVFGANDAITREQLAVILYHYSGSPQVKGQVTMFDDLHAVSSYAADAVQWAVENGIISGMGNNQLCPRATATRAQVAQMIKNYLDRSI